MNTDFVLGVLSIFGLYVSCILSASKWDKGRIWKLLPLIYGIVVGIFSTFYRGKTTDILLFFILGIIFNIFTGGEVARGKKYEAESKK